MMKPNLDRFARPLDSERVGGFWMQDYIQEQQELNKKHIVQDYISSFWNDFYLVPSAEHVQEALYKIDLDLDLIQNELERF
jgi:hypothetical protein